MHTVVQQFGTFQYKGETVTPQTEMKYLGVVFDNKLSFNTQIDNIIKKTNFALFTMKSVRSYVPRGILISFMHCFVFSNLDYCNTIYFMLPQDQLYRLQKVINRAARVIYSLKMSQPITAYLIKLHWLPIGPRLDFKVILLAFKSLDSGEPLYLKTALTPGGVIATRTRFFEPRLPGGHSAARRAFEIAAPRLLNKLPESVFNSGSINTLKKNLKTYLFTEGFSYKLHSILEYTPSDDVYTYKV